MKLHVGVFFGGKATEHEVSVISALQAIENMDKEKYEIIPVYISKDEQFYTSEQLLDIDNYKKLNELLSNSQKISFSKYENKIYLNKVPAKLFNKPINYIDLAFPVMHGNKGENGGIQGFLEVLDIPYVGSPVIASAIGMDKDIAKIVAKSIEVPVVDWVSFNKYEYFDNVQKVLGEILEKLEFPMIIKPANGGSSIGIEVAQDMVGLRAAIEQVFNFDIKIIVENKVTKIREVNCSVLGDISDAKASVIEEPSTESEILSFEDKYMQNSSKGMSSATRQIPANISEDMTKDIKDYSVRLFKKLGCAGVVRIDYIIDSEKEQVYFNEINTIPGSLSFYLWKHDNIEYKDEIDELFKVANRVYKRNKEINYVFDNNLFDSNGLNIKGKLKG